MNPSALRARVRVAGLDLARLKNARSEGPANPQEIAAMQRLRSRVAALAPIGVGQSPAQQGWFDYRRAVRESIATRDPRFFLHWDVIARTMTLSPRTRFMIDVEIPELRAAGWLERLPDRARTRANYANGTTIDIDAAHHGYHLYRFERAVGRSAAAYDSVAEIGGGYGSMCRLVNHLAGTPVQYDIFDFPEFGALQEYFLSSLDLDVHFVTDASQARPAKGERLLIATWSLSEMPLDERAAALRGLGPFDAYLIGYQPQFRDVDNYEYFLELASSMPEIEWHTEEIKQIPGHRYLFGVRRS